MFNYRWIVTFLSLLLFIGCGDIEEQIDRPFHFEEPIEHLAPSAPPKPSDCRTQVKAFYVVAADQELHSSFNRYAEIIRGSLQQSQDFFEREMIRHGYGDKTFEMVRDWNDEIVITKIQLAHPRLSYTSRSMDASIELQHLLGNDVYEQYLPVFFININGMPICGHANFYDLSGWAINYCFNWRTVSHEIGHALGLDHDFRDDRYMMSYGQKRDQLSENAALWLSYHHMFNDSTLDFWNYDDSYNFVNYRWNTFHVLDLDPFTIQFDINEYPDYRRYLLNYELAKIQILNNENEIVADHIFSEQIFYGENENGDTCKIIFDIDITSHISTLRLNMIGHNVPEIQKGSWGIDHLPIIRELKKEAAD